MPSTSWEGLWKWTIPFLRRAASASEGEALQGRAPVIASVENRCKMEKFAKIRHVDKVDEKKIRYIAHDGLHDASVPRTDGLHGYRTLKEW